MLSQLPTILRIREILHNLEQYPAFWICLYILIPITIVVSFSFLRYIFKKLRIIESKEINPDMREISKYIQEGARVYLKDQGKALALILGILSIPVGFNGISYADNPIASFMATMIIFLVGSFGSFLASYIGMTSATRTNVLVLETAIEDPNEAFRVAYLGGMVTGILNISIFIIGIWLILLISDGNIFLMVSFNFGASVSSLITQVGGGIYTKSADMGADLAGKYDLGIEEDDPRNPAIIADLVGDNVGDCAARGADLYETASSDAISGMVLGSSLFVLLGNPIYIITNLTIISLGLLSLFFSTLFLKINFDRPSRSIWRVFNSATLFNIVVLIFICLFLFGQYGWYLFFPSLFGLLAVYYMVAHNTYFTNIDYKPTYRITEYSNENPALSVISGLANGLSSVALPMIVFCITIILCYSFGHAFGKEILTSGNYTVDIFGQEIDYATSLLIFGIWGVNMASMSSDLIISSVLAFDSFGPIMDNAAGISEICKGNCDEKTLSNLDKMDSLGNSTKAIAKGFSLICGGLSSIVMFLTFLSTTRALAPEMDNQYISDNDLIHIFDLVNIHDPLIIMGICIGMIIPVVFSSRVLYAVLLGAKKMVQEVKCQFEKIPGLKEGTLGVKPDYEECIDISAKNALRNLLKPVFIIIVIIITTGVLFGPMVVAALLIGNFTTCVVLGLFMCIGGGSLDNAKKGIENGLFGGKGSPAHKASIIGDTVGDPLKDTAGPSMNSLITTVNTLALTFLPLFIMTGYLWSLFGI